MRDPGRLGRLRVAGLVASALLAAGAFGAGAPPGSASRPNSPAPSSWDYWAGRPGGYWAGLAAYLAGLLLFSVTWWRLGGRLDRAPGAVSTRWLLATAALWVAPLLVAPPLGSRDVYSYACQGALWLDGADPYRTGVEPGGCVWSAAVAPDWRATPTPYGPLAVVLAGAAVAVARAVSGSDGLRLLIVVGLLRVVALAGVLLVAGFLPRLARACGVDAAAATWLALLSPLAAIHLVSGAHNDALMVGLVVAALATAVAPDRPRRPPPGLVAGAVLGAAVAIKVTAVLVVPFVVLLAAMGTVRRPIVVGALVRAGAAGCGAGAVGFAGLTLATGLDLGWTAALADTGRLVQWTSLPTGLGMAVGYLLRLAGAPEAFGTAVAAARAVGAAVLVVGGAVLVGTIARRVLRGTAAARDVVAGSGLALAGFALLAPVFYPWYALAAFVVLAAAVADRRWRCRLAALVLGLGLLVLPDGLGLAVLTKLPGALFDLVLVIALVVLAVRRSFAHRRRIRARLR